MPAYFKANYPATPIIIDCTNLFIERPYFISCSVTDVPVIQEPQHCKGLVGIAPSRIVTVISCLLVGGGGHISNKK